MTNEMMQLDETVQSGENMQGQILQTNEYGDVTEAIPTEALPMEVSPMEVPTDAVILSSASSESTEESWEAFRANTAAFWENTTRSATAFFKENRQLFSQLGWLFLGFLGVKILFASLDAIDDVPLMSPLLKLVGLVYVVRFVWRYLVRATDRQQLSQKFDQIKTEFLGS